VRATATVSPSKGYGLALPRIPGHEISGVIDGLGAGAAGWRAGQRVGVGWFGGHCGYREPCRRGRLTDCRNLRIPGISYDGGSAEAIVVPADALAAETAAAFFALGRHLPCAAPQRRDAAPPRRSPMPG
jgi:D-arabinose 1-dehydrogenase-like Zn-dependent alcohol dehydrogenase